MRAALHAHILVFFKPREVRKDYKPLPALERIVPGHEPRQRARDSTVPPLREHQNDNVYQTHHVGPMVAEMVRPDVRGPSWGGYDVDKLRIAGLARAVQQRLPYLHPCNPVYCLKDRTACRFFFPWPYRRNTAGFNRFQSVSDHAHVGKRVVRRRPLWYQPHQCFCENTQRVAMQRRLPEDDSFVVPHNLYLTMFSPASVNVLAFEPPS